MQELLGEASIHTARLRFSPGKKRKMATISSKTSPFFEGVYIRDELVRTTGTSGMSN